MAAQCPPTPQSPHQNCVLAPTRALSRALHPQLAHCHLHFRDPTFSSDNAQLPSGKNGTGHFTLCPDHSSLETGFSWKWSSLWGIIISKL